MKRTVLISIIASTVIFGADIKDVKVEQSNKVQSSRIGNTTLIQGQTDIKDTSVVDTLNITQENKTINSAIKNANVTQGQTDIKGSSSVNNLTINQKENGNVIDGLFTDNTSLNDLNISQGKTLVEEATVRDVTVDSDSFLRADVDGAGLISQGTLSVTDNAILVNTDIKSNNVINKTDIENSTLKQAFVDINGQGTTVSKLDVNQENTINDGSAINSTTLQGNIKVNVSADIGDPNDVEISGLKVESVNKMDGYSSENSKTSQNSINLTRFSKIRNTTINSTNKISDTEATNNSQITQNTYNIISSTVDGLETTHTNTIINSTIDDTNVTQDLIEFRDVRINQNNTFESENTINGLTANSSKGVYQAVNVIRTKDNSGNSLGVDTYITGADIKSKNNIENIGLGNDSEVAQNYVSIVGSRINSTLKIDNENDFSNSDIKNGSSVKQAEVILAKANPVSTISQQTINSISNSTIDNTSIEQAKIAIGDSEIDGTGVKSEATNTIESSLKDSSVSQNGLNICDSTVEGLSINQNNEISGGSVSGSTLNQGNTNISGTEDCDDILVRAKYSNLTF